MAAQPIVNGTLGVLDAEPFFSVSFALYDSALGSAYLRRLTRFDYRRSRLHIDDLPVEILARSLILVPDRFNEHPERWHESRLIVSHVSQRWRTTVNTNPAFFSAIYIDHETEPRLLHQWISRSKALPLTFAFNLVLRDISTFAKQAVRTKIMRIVLSLAPVMGRCERIYVGAADPASSRVILLALSHLDAGAVKHACLMLRPYPMELQRTTETDRVFLLPRLFKDNMPALRHLLITSMFVDWRFSPLFSSLTYLQLENLSDEFSPTVDELLALFHGTPLLTRLHLDNVECIGFDHYELQYPTLPFLTHLFFGASSDIASCFLAFLMLPALHTLNLELRSEEALVAFFDHFIGRGDTVTSLVLDLPLTGYQTFLEIPRVFPNVRRLDGRDNAPFFSVSLHTVAVHWPGRYHALRELWMTDFVEPVVLHTMLVGLTGDARSGLRVVSSVGLDTSGKVTVPRRAFLNQDDNIEYGCCVTSCNLFDF